MELSTLTFKPPLSAIDEIVQATMSIGSLPADVSSKIIQLRCLQDGWDYESVMDLRCFSRAFNRGVLSHYFASSENVPPKVRETSLHTVQYNNLLVRRLLQGCILGSSAQSRGSPRWESRLRTVVDLVREQHCQGPHYRPSSSVWFATPPQNIGLNGLFDDYASILSCDAVISYYSRDRIWEAIKLRNDRRRGLNLRSEPIEFWLFLVACFSGDLIRVVATYRNLQRSEAYGPAAQSGLSSKLSNCLHVAAREGHEGIVCYLLGRGADLESRISVDPLRASAFENCLLAATETGQMKILRLLLPFCAETEAPRIKGRMLWIACKFNNVSVAQFILGTGSVQVYDLQAYNLERPQYAFGNPLLVAYRNGHSDCVRLLLQNQHQYCEASAASKASFTKGLVGPYRCTKRREVFTEVVPFLDAKQALLTGTAVERGVELVIRRRGPYDLGTKHPRRRGGYESTLGAQALRRSVEFGRVSNVRFLLARGIKITNKVGIWSGGGLDFPQTILNLFEAAAHGGVLSDDREYFIPHDSASSPTLSDTDPWGEQQMETRPSKASMIQRTRSLCV